jgi:hypothetical protein
METPSRPPSVKIVVIALALIAAYDVLAIIRSLATKPSTPEVSFPVVLALLDPLVLLAAAFGYWNLKKWSVLLVAAYVALGFLLLLLTRLQGIPMPGIASVLILISMATEWRRRTLA